MTSNFSSRSAAKSNASSSKAGRNDEPAKAGFALAHAL
jgi:hypothetical protein